MKGSFILDSKYQDCMIIKHCRHVFGEIYEVRKGLWAFFLTVDWICVGIRDLKQTAEVGDGNVGKTIKLITQDKNAREYVRSKTDICTVLLSNENSTAPFPRCLQHVTDISKTNVHHFVQKETLKSSEFQQR